MKRYITLPNGKAISLGSYAKAWRTLKTLPPETHTPGFSYSFDTAASVLREIRKGMHERINKHLDRHGKRYENDIIPQLKYRVRCGLPYSDLYTR